MQTLHSCWTAFQLNWRKLHLNSLLISLSVTTNADAFLHKGNVWAHDQLSPLWRNTRKKYTSQESNPCIRPKFVKYVDESLELFKEKQYQVTWSRAYLPLTSGVTTNSHSKAVRASFSVAWKNSRAKAPHTAG